MPDDNLDVSPDRVFAAPANGPAQETTIPPGAIDELFDQADLAAAIEQLARTLDRQRKEIVLLWVGLVLVTGLLTYRYARALLAGHGLELDDA